MGSYIRWSLKTSLTFSKCPYDIISLSVWITDSPSKWIWICYGNQVPSFQGKVQQLIFMGQLTNWVAKVDTAHRLCIVSWDMSVHMANIIFGQNCLLEIVFSYSHIWYLLLLSQSSHETLSQLNMFSFHCMLSGASIYSMYITFYHHTVILCPSSRLDCIKMFHKMSQKSAGIFCDNRSFYDTRFDHLLSLQR